MTCGSVLWKTGVPTDNSEAMSDVNQNPNAAQGSSSAPAPGWFAVYTASHHEKQVQEQLRERQVEAFLPLYRAPRQWKKRKAVTLELPLFPN